MIATPKQLARFLELLDDSPYVAMDTEADSLYSYPERLCLLQISLPGYNELIDPLSRLDLTPLFDRLSKRELILHGADYDLRLLYKTHGFRPSTLFDTMIAARLDGERAFGLGSLTEKYFGVKMEKTSQKANWSMRPLPRKLQSYARADARYLYPLSRVLRENLSHKGRFEWAEESCAKSIEECSRIREPDEERVWRVKGSARLEARELALLRELWHWREKEALRAHRPPYFVLSHQKLVRFAEAGCKKEPLAPIFPRRFPHHLQRGVEDAVARGLAIPRAERPDPRPGRAREDGPRHRLDERRFRELKRRRDARAEELDLDPTLIASRVVLENLARSWDHFSGELMTWQRELLTQRADLDRVLPTAATSRH